MADEGNEPTSDELWADTNPGGSQGPGGDPPAAQPDPTLVQPVIGGGPPPLPPGAGGPGGPGGLPPGGPPPDEFDEGRPAWLLPVAAGLIGALVLGLVLVLLLNSGDDDDTATTTTLAPTDTSDVATSVPEPTAAATTTTEEPPETTVEETTTTSEATTTTVAETTTTLPATTSTVDPTPPFPDAGFAVVSNVTYPLQAACFTVPLEPNTGEYQVASYLVATVSGPLVLDRWFDEGAVNGVDGEFWGPGRLLNGAAVEGDDVSSSFSATMSPADDPGNSFTIAVNPPDDGIETCDDKVVTRDADDDELSQYTRSILDVCAARPAPDRVDVAGIASEGSQFDVFDNGDGDATIVYIDRTTDGPLTDPDASITLDDDIIRFEGRVEGEGADAEIRNLIIEFDVGTARVCSTAEAPS